GPVESAHGGIRGALGRIALQGLAVSPFMMQRLRASLSWLLAAAFVGVNLAFIAQFLVVSLARDTYPFELEWFEGLAIDHAWRIIHGLPIYGLPDATFAAGYSPPLFYLVTLPFIVASGWTLWGA